MKEVYRGHSIRVSRAQSWEAVIIEIESGMMLPTKATALLHEGPSVAVARACELVDLYLGRPMEEWHAA